MLGVMLLIVGIIPARAGNRLKKRRYRIVLYEMEGKSIYFARKQAAQFVGLLFFCQGSGVAYAIARKGFLPSVGGKARS